MRYQGDKMTAFNRRDVLRTSIATAASGLPSLAVWAADEQHLRIQSNALNSLDPAHQTSAGDEGRIAILVSNALMRYVPGAKYDLVPDLATGFEVADGGKTYTFRLRKDVKWHGGFGMFTARDVKWSIERILNPETKSRNAGQMQEIAAVEVVDEHTVRFRLKAPSAVFPHALATFRGGFMMCEAAAKAQGAEYGRQIIGTGPFVVEKAVLDQEVVLRRNDDYFGTKPRLERVTFRIIRESSTATLAFDRGQLDIVAVKERENIDRYMRNPKADVRVSDVSTGIFLLSFNTSKAPFDRKEVRQAFQHAIDKKAIVQAVYAQRGRVIDTVVPPGVEGYTDAVRRYEHDPAKARKMLADAGVANLVCTLTIPTDYQREAVMLQAQLKAAGVTLNLKMIDRPTWFRALGQGEHDIIWNAHFRAPVADAFLFASYHSSNQPPKGTNCAFYAGIDDLIDKARVTFDDKQRAALYSEALKRIAEDSPAIPLTLELNTHVVQKYVKGLGPYRVPENAPLVETAFVEK